MKFSGMQSVSAMYTTGDPASAVLNYYQEKLGPNATTTDRNGTTVLTVTSAAGNMKDSVIISVTPGAQAGGATQILFGIRGKRWDADARISRLYNEWWVRPAPEERVAGADRVENACYW